MRRRIALLTVCVLAGIVSVPVVLTWRQVRQYTLNRQLIAALVKGDDRMALALVNVGADPNTRYTPTPASSLPDLMSQILHRSLPPPTNDSPTAFMIACGASWNNDEATSTAQANRPDARQLVLAMLPHVTNVNTLDEHGWPPLVSAIYLDRVNTVRVLLEHGAEVNARDGYGMMALYWAVYYKADHDIIRQLVAHGADPNLSIKYGDTNDTPLKLAQRNSPDIIALLKRTGATK